MSIHGEMRKYPSFRNYKTIKKYINSDSGETGYGKWHTGKCSIRENPISGNERGETSTLPTSYDATYLRTGQNGTVNFLVNYEFLCFFFSDKKKNNDSYKKIKSKNIK